MKGLLHKSEVLSYLGPLGHGCLILLNKVCDQHSIFI